MELHSLGYRTDLIFPRYEGEVTDKGDYFVIRTPSNPTFHWGNFLLFAAPPQTGDKERWEQLFADEIGPYPGVSHRAFGWDAPDGDMGEVQPFRDAGYRLDEAVILTAQTVHPPPKTNTEITVRPLSSDEEWQQALHNQVVCRGEEYEFDSYMVYKQRQMERYRAMAEAGLGAWFGAFLGDTVTGDFGIYRDGPIARFQSVGVRPEFRRRGVCGTMIYQGSQWAFKEMGSETLVMAADEHYHAAKIYESVGFKPTEKQIGMDLWNRDASM